MAVLASATPATAAGAPAPAGPTAAANRLLRLDVDHVNPGDLVDQIYLDMLDRPADAKGREFWASAIASGTTPTDVINGFINSAEVGGAYEPVIRLYRASFLRPPDRKGLTYWVRKLRSGTGRQAVAQVFATSREFVNRYGSLNDRDYVDRVYRNVLQRPPDAQGLTYWTTELRRGMSRGRMLLAFADSTENVRRTTVSSRMSLLSITLLRTIPGTDETDRWDRRSPDLSTRKLISEVLASDQYRRRLAKLFPAKLPLTGQYSRRPIGRPALAVKTDNVDRARPHVGLNLADIVYEEMVEGNLTRLIAVYHGQSPATVGPVRSIRVSDFDVLTPFNRPLLAASGANPGVLRQLKSAPVVNVNALVVNDYWRDGSRRAPHNMMTSPSRLWTHAPGNAGPPPVMFPANSKPSTGPAAGAGADIRFGRADVSWRWDGRAGVWRRWQNGTPHVDSNGRAVGAENVVIMVVKYTPNAIDANSPEAHTVGRGSAVMFIDGQRVEGTWQRRSATAPVRFNDSRGRPVTFRPGQTWVELAPPGSVKVNR